MNLKITFSTLFLLISLFVFSQRTTLTITGNQVSAVSYTNQEVILNGQTDLHVTAATAKQSLTNSVVDLNTINSWIFFDNIKPSIVVDSILQYINISGQPAVPLTNARVSIYKHGTVVIPQSSTFKPLTVYNGQNFTGDSASYSLYTFNTVLGAFDNKIRSFKLKRGYAATLATTSDGTGYSRVYIASDQDMAVGVMPNLLDKSISFIRVLDWEWVTKKGWGGSTVADANKVNTTWRYNWDANSPTTSTVEYVPMESKTGYPTWTTINGLTYVSHLLGFNEPDHPEQSNMTVSQALAQWPGLLRSGLRVGSPAVTTNSWLYSFMDSCKAKNYRVDYVCYHAYWGGKSPANWYNDLKSIYLATGRPIWITEWNDGANWTTEGGWDRDATSTSSPQPLLNTLANFKKELADLKGILQVLDTASFIERYSIYNWVENARSMLDNVNDTLTMAGKYYASDTSVMAFKRKYEVIPTYNYTAPTLSIAFGTTNVTLTDSDPNVESFNGIILEKKTGTGSYSQIGSYVNMTSKKCLDSLVLTPTASVRYRIKTIFMDGTLSAYSNEVGYDVSTGGTIEYGNLSFSNVGWNPVLFVQPFTSVLNPAIVLGAVSNNNSKLLTPRVNLLTNARFNVQLAPWVYQNVSSLTSAESIPYLALNIGSYNFGGLTAQAARATVTSTWSHVTFANAFDSIPVVFASQLFPATTFATDVRVRNITTTGFDAILQKETKVTTKLNPETISYVAITPGTGEMDSKKIIVGRTANNTISTTAATKINFGDSIANPIFISQLQTCNDDTVTAVLRCISLTPKYATVAKQRERSTTATVVGTESAGWMVINPVTNQIQGLSIPTVEELSFYPNPVKDFIYLKQDNPENFNVNIFNLVGVLVKSINLSGNEIDVRDLQPGCYIIRTLNHGSNKFIKL